MTVTLLAKVVRWSASWSALSPPPTTAISVAGRAVGDAAPRQLGLARHAELTIPGPGRDDDGLRLVCRPARVDDEPGLARFDRDRLGADELGAERLGVLDHLRGELHAVDRTCPGVVLDDLGRRGVPARHHHLEDERLDASPSSVHAGRQPRGAPADDNKVVAVHRASLKRRTWSVVSMT